MRVSTSKRNQACARAPVDQHKKWIAGRKYWETKNYYKTNIHWKIMHKMVNCVRSSERSATTTTTAAPANSSSDVPGRRGSSSTSKHYVCICHTRHPNGHTMPEISESRMKNSFRMRFLTNFIVSLAGMNAYYIQRLCGISISCW